MGLFDELKKLGKEIENGIGKDVIDGIKNAVESVSEEVKGEGVNKTEGGKTIPEEYSEFPKFRETADEVETKETPNYIRCTMDFRNATDEEVNNYISEIIAERYLKATDVRYDKGNTYIIVERGYNDLHLVFHIRR